MSLTTTLVLGGACLLIAVFCGWRGARKPNLNRGPRLIPWRALMVSATVVTLLCLLHLFHINDS